LGRIKEAYRASLKQKDNFWTEVLTRPVAAVFLVGLERTPITPNQVTFLSFFVEWIAIALLVLWRDWPGLVAAAVVLQLSYVFDCVDGQLARLRGIPSPIGHLLDFLMDELKAFLVLGAIATRLYLVHGGAEYLLLGLWGLVAVASGISLTTFLRRPEYLATAPAPATPATPATGAPAPAPPARRSLLGWSIFGAERFARFLIHYPSWFFYVAIFDQLDLFFFVFVGVHTLYLARAFLSVVRRLGRFGFVPPRPA